jgi:hypothetical protein
LLDSKRLQTICTFVSSSLPGEHILQSLAGNGERDKVRGKIVAWGVAKSLHPNPLPTKPKRGRRQMRHVWAEKRRNHTSFPWYPSGRPEPCPPAISRHATRVRFQHLLLSTDSATGFSVEKFIRPSRREEARALRLILRHSPGVVPANRTYVLGLDSVQSLQAAGIVFKQFCRTGHATGHDGGYGKRI